MTYHRITDIKTPPFAYVVNRDVAIQSCALCMMPSPCLNESLKAEIFTTEVDNWQQEIQGQPLMAEHWLIGDQLFVDRLRDILGPCFDVESIEIVSWLSRSPTALRSQQTADSTASKRVPEFFRVIPHQTVPLDHGLTDRFPPINCSSCQRDIPDIPFDVQLVPDESGAQPAFAYLADIHYEGYDYLIRADRSDVLSKHFPRMILEPLEPGEPSLF